jgi:hypothetical protein
MKKILCWVSVLALAALIVVPASASTIVYNNDFGGVVSGDNFNEDAWTINFGYSVANSFVLGSSTTITGANVAVWAFPGDSLTSVDWAILANDGANPLTGTVIASGTADPTGTVLLADNAYGYPILNEYFGIPGLALTGGTTYWFVLDNAIVPSGDPIYWDQSDGPSIYYENSIGYFPGSGYQCNGLCTGSESFELLSGSFIPEPGTLTLLGCGLLALGAFGRRKK